MIKNKIATKSNNVTYICDNSDYVINFDFDDEWDWEDDDHETYGIQEINMNNYKEILEIVKDEKIANGVIQAMLLTGLGYKEILKSMGFKI